MRKRKGLTPIIATVLLLMMTIAAFGMAYVWLQKFQQKTQDAVGENVNTLVDTLSTSLRIISVYNDTSSTQGDTVIVIKNTGQDAIPGDWLSGATVKVDGIVQTFTNPSVDLPSQGTAEFRSSSYLFKNLADGKTHTITIDIKDKPISTTCGPLSPDANACNI